MNLSLPRNILLIFCQIIAFAGFAQRIDFTPLNIFSRDEGRIELAGRFGGTFLTVQYSNGSDTVNIILYDPTLNTIDKKSIIQPELNRAIQVGYIINGDSCFLVTQTISSSIIKIGVVGIDKLGQVFQPYKILDEFNTEEKKPVPFSFQYFQYENAVLLSKWKLVPGTRKLGALRIINSKGEIVSKQQILTGYLDEKENLDLFLYKGEAYAAMQMMSSEFSSIPKTIIYKSSTAVAIDPINIQQSGFYLGNLKFSINPFTNDLYLAGLSFNSKTKRSGGLALLKLNGLKSSDQFQIKIFDESLYQNMYTKKKDRKKLLEDEIVLEKFEFNAFGKVVAYIHKMDYYLEDMAKSIVYFPEYRMVNAGYTNNNLTPSQNFDRMRYDFQNTPYGSLSASPNSGISRTGSNLAGVQPIDFSGTYSPPTVSQATETDHSYSKNETGVLTNDLLTIEERGTGELKNKELSRSKLSMRTLPVTMVNSLLDSEFVSIQYPEGREHIIFQGKKTAGTDLSTMAYYSEKFYPFYKQGVLIYAGYRKMATLYLNKETAEVGIALLSW